MSDTPLWSPSAAGDTILAKFMSYVAVQTGITYDNYHDLWAWSVRDVGTFWSLVWDFTGVMGDKGNMPVALAPHMKDTKFFPEARLNWAENLLRRRDDDIAIISRAEKKDEMQISFHDLAMRVAQLQTFLKQNGIQKGDRVAGYMPNITETIIGALAAASIGAIWSSASPDFGVQGVIDRFGQIEPKILITTDGYFYSGKTIDNIQKLKEIIPLIPSIQKTILIPLINDNPPMHELPNCTAWSDILNINATAPSFERVEFNHPLFIMFSSGTTGIPKCIVHGHGGTLLQHIKEHQLQCDIKPNDRVFYFTTCGWMMWNWQISALASGASLILYDGSPFFPKADVLWEYTSRHKATLFGTGAKYIDALKAHNIRPCDKFDLSSLRTITSTGSPLVHESFDYVYDAIKHDVHLASISGGTDIVSCFVIGNPISPVYRGEIQGAGLGYDIAVYDDNAHIMSHGSGEMVCKMPFPSMPTMFWNDADGSKYFKAYFDRFDNVWCHGDWIERTAHDGFIIHGRSDTTLNPGGVRIGTAEIYRQVEQIPEVLESIAVGQMFQGDERVILFVRLKDGFTLNEDIKTRLKNQIKTGASPRHVPAKIIEIADIPRTKSNKIVELAVKEVIHNRPVKNVESLANPEALDLYKDLIDLAG
jgi:acetoacetyl-CoA synthetase